MSENNRMRLLWAGFMAILAAGVGFAVRGGIFDNWGKDFGFTGAQLGAIGGAGFSGFCFGIIIGGVIVDKIGYGKLVALALACHVLSAFVTFGASTPENAYQFLFWGMFIFAYANGTLEAVANPLVATLFPENRTPLGLQAWCWVQPPVGCSTTRCRWVGKSSSPSTSSPPCSTR
jgi:fucose permease